MFAHPHSKVGDTPPLLRHTSLQRLQTLGTWYDYRLYQKETGGLLTWNRTISWGAFQIHREQGTKSASVLEMASNSPYEINCIITGAGGFIGQALAAALLSDPEGSISKLILIDIFEPPSPKTEPESQHIEIVCLKADLTSPSTCTALFTPNINCVYMLHGIMSSQAEANLDLGLKVNLDSTRLILDHLRANNPDVRIVFTSSTAVYGPLPTPEFVFTETTAPDPRSSYGAQKLVCETLLNDYSRRGLLDGRICRLPTVRKFQTFR